MKRMTKFNTTAHPFRDFDNLRHFQNLAQFQDHFLFLEELEDFQMDRPRPLVLQRTLLRGPLRCLARSFEPLKILRSDGRTVQYIEV